MRFKLLGFFGLLVLLSAFIYSTEIRVLNFKQFEPHLHQNTDTTYVINFWATWCVPCRKEIPDFERFNTEFENQKVRVLLVSLDVPYNLDNTLKPFIEQHHIQSEVVVLDDPNSNYWINKVDSSWSGTIPATLIYSRNYRKFFPHPLTYEKLDSIVKLNIIKP